MSFSNSCSEICGPPKSILDVNYEPNQFKIVGKQSRVENARNTTTNNNSNKNSKIHEKTARKATTNSRITVVFACQHWEGYERRHANTATAECLNPLEDWES